MKKKIKDDLTHGVHTLGERGVDGPAKIRIDMGGSGEGKIQFVGVGRFSNQARDRSRSPRRYVDQLKELNDKAARTIQLYWLYSCRKPETRAHFLKKFSKARSTLGSDGLFRKFLLHFVSLPGNEGVDKALLNYKKVLSKASK